MNEIKNDRSSITVMIIISAMILFPVLLSVYAHFDSPHSPLTEPPVFDTTSIQGYTYFKAMGIVVDENSNPGLYNNIYPLIGFPHRNRAGGRGLDCSGLVRQVYHQTFDIRIKGSSRDIFRNSLPISKDEIQESDLLFFNINSSQINHVGIYLDNGKFVHVSVLAGVSINDLSENYYQKHFYRAGRIIRE